MRLKCDKLIADGARVEISKTQCMLSEFTMKYCLPFLAMSSQLAMNWAAVPGLELRNPWLGCASSHQLWPSCKSWARAEISWALATLCLDSVAGAQLSSAPAQLCPKRRVWELGAELSCQNDGSNSGTAAQVTASYTLDKAGSKDLNMYHHIHQ